MSHPLSIIPISASRLLERFAYYGMRSIVVLYMTQKLGLTHEQTFSVYGLLTAAVGLMSIFGGLLGDLAIGTRLSAIIGGFVEATGILLLAVPGVIPVYVGLFLIAIGSGLYAPNLLSMVSFAYKDREQKLDAAYTIVYVCINIGAMLAPLAIGYLGETINYQSGFAVAGFAMIGAQLFLLISRGLAAQMPKGPNIKLPSDTSTRKSLPPALVIVAVFFTMILFWQLYEYIESPIYERLVEADSMFPGLSARLGIFTGGATIPLGIALVLVFTFFNTSSFLKMFTGCIVLIFACIIIALGSTISMSGGWLAVIIAGGILQCTAELLIMPVALSVVAKYSPVKFRGTIFGAYLTVSAMIGYIVSSIFHFSYSSPLWIMVPVSVGIITILAGIYLTFYLLSRKEA